MRKDITTYQRLAKNIVREIGLLQPGADPKLVGHLNKKLKKYSEKINILAKA